MTSRPSPAAIASKQGSGITPSAPAFVRHCSPTADVMPLAKHVTRKAAYNIVTRFFRNAAHRWELGEKLGKRQTDLTNMYGPGSAKSATELIPK